MTQLVECIPNFSEGRNQETLKALSDAAKSLPGVLLVNYSADADHNRSVFTLIGEPDGVLDAVMAMCRVAVARIDLRKHTGVHPRMGAVDVIPFVPIRGMDSAECVALSRRAAKRIYDELGVPSILYEDSATAEHRRNLPTFAAANLKACPKSCFSTTGRPISVSAVSIRRQALSPSAQGCRSSPSTST
jgi:glutamate formiminotransferase